MSKNIKFAVVDKYDDMERVTIVEAENPAQAMLSAFPNTEDLEKYEISTIGIYEVGDYNHLETILETQNKSAWATKKIEELEKKVEGSDK
ncbi:hypothetical protein AB6831_04130 [Carnobacterium divergens]|uniref:hypothetical protein n=1 Tax=Carnobacterium divergens TaxID=2748 RepID=UPI0039C99418